MNIRARKIYEALFALEDLREIFRQALPTGLDENEEEQLLDGIVRVETIIRELKEGKGSPIKYIEDKIELRTREEEYININAIQPGGRLTAEARKALIAYGDGYSVCDKCLEGRLDKIRKPPVDEFHAELADFVGMDEARVVPGARRGFQAVASSLLDKGDVVIVSDLAHYTEFLAVENVGGVIKEVPSGDKNIITCDAVAEKIDNVKKELGRLPKLIIIEHFDYRFGNEHDVYGVGKVAKEYDIPFLYNGAYSVGMAPVNGKKIGADFVVGSGHKGMAAVAPSGVLATTDEWAPEVFRGSEIVGDVTGRSFKHKESEMLGCTLMGGTLLSMMASFPRVKERVKRWEEEVEKSNYFIHEFLRIEGNKVSSEYPRKHTLSKVDTRDSFDRIAKTHKRRGFFLSDELKRRGIVGQFAGSTRVWELNTYGLSWSRIKYLSEAFIEIAGKYEMHIR
uniref:O-phospho-L-seryl-tRNA:Cys-tRNA synthase n=1 Tax=Candidatus Methanophagaceae archaeon ANME-1 ERB6 TaxID=2759912 RepID=A0A7G9Z0D1_9EURY|nr:O-phospho-L-seryl-tRNA:Cys-tRNA synthase [Methanosarcinales archaeon ANME-1 ERB6]